MKSIRWYSNQTHIHMGGRRLRNQTTCFNQSHPHGKSTEKSQFEWRRTWDCLGQEYYGILQHIPGHNDNRMENQLRQKPNLLHVHFHLFAHKCASISLTQLGPCFPFSWNVNWSECLRVSNCFVRLRTTNRIFFSITFCYY